MFRKKYKLSYSDKMKQEVKTDVFRLLKDERLMKKYKNYERLINKISKITTFKYNTDIELENKEFKYKLSCDSGFMIDKKDKKYHLYVFLHATDICHLYIEKHLETFIKLYQKQFKDSDK
jgi:hypothetical protein